MECVAYVCVWLGGLGGEGGGEWMRELGLDFTNPVGTGRVLDMCLCFGCGGVGGVGGGGGGGVFRDLGPGSGPVVWCYVYERCESGFSVQMAGPGICILCLASCTQCSIMLHLMDICFLSCICLWQISQIQTCLFKVVRPGLVSTSPAFVSSSASHPAGPHAQKTVNRAPIAGRGKVRHNLHSSLSPL